MAKRTYTDEEKAAALKVLSDPELSFYEVRDRTGVPVGTLHRWATEAGLKRSDEKTEAAAARRRLRLSVKREVIAEVLLDRVEDLMGRMDQPHVVGYDDGQAVVFPMGASSDCKNYMTAAAIALDKFRLEMGEHTEHHRHDERPAEKVRTSLDELRARREEKAS